MSSFNQPIDLRHYPGYPTKVSTLRELHWESDYGDSSLTVSVRSGFIHDAASVPWMLKWVIDPMESGIIRAAAIHDYMYWTHRYDQREATRREADREFHRALKVDGMKLIRRNLAWAAVRVGGQKAWNAETKNRIDHQANAERHQILHALSQTDSHLAA